MGKCSQGTCSWLRSHPRASYGGTHAWTTWRVSVAHDVPLPVALAYPLPLPTRCLALARCPYSPRAAWRVSVLASLALVKSQTAGTWYPWGVTPFELDPPTRLFKQHAVRHGPRVDKRTRGEGVSEPVFTLPSQHVR